MKAIAVTHGDDKDDKDPIPLGTVVKVLRIHNNFAFWGKQEGEEETFFLWEGCAYLHGGEWELTDEE